MIPNLEMGWVLLQYQKNMSNNTILYKYLSTEHIKEILEKQRLKLSDGKSFNDPFDVAVVDQRRRKHIKLEGLFILCLTNSYRKKLMWSYYADSHKGVCLSISVPAHLVYPICYTSKKVYSDSSIADIDRILQNAKIFCKKNLLKPTEHLPREKKIALIKDQKWEAEKEYRIVFGCQERGLIIEKDEKTGKNNVFLSVKIQNVYLGNQIDEQTKKEILKICRKNKISVKQMVLAENNYSLNIESIN